MSNKGLWAKLKRFGEVIGSDVTGTNVPGDKHALDVAIKESIAIPFTQGAEAKSIDGFTFSNSTTYVAVPAVAGFEIIHAMIDNTSPGAGEVTVSFDGGTTDDKTLQAGDVYGVCLDGSSLTQIHLKGDTTAATAEIVLQRKLS